MKIILASASPRRRELLEMLKVKNLEIIPTSGYEAEHPALAPAELVRVLSLEKALEVADARPNDVVIGADTVVSLDNKVLGKPKDEEDARRMLRALSGRTHRVFTGVTVLYNGRIDSQAERSDVWFKTLTEDEIDAYMKTGEPMDKSGAYGAQGFGSLFVSRIEGDFFNVMGLPVCRLGVMLKKLGVDLI